jgi:hypothetical protein
MLNTASHILIKNNCSRDSEKKHKNLKSDMKKDLTPSIIHI